MNANGGISETNYDTLQPHYYALRYYANAAITWKCHASKFLKTEY